MLSSDDIKFQYTEESSDNMNRKRYAVLLLTVLCASIILALIGCGGTPTTTTTPTPSSTASSGAQIYADDCARCHGTNRQGTSLGIALPKTNPVIANDSAADLATFIRVHRIALSFTTEQMTALVGFLKTG
jgi:hypothetical protein